MNNKYLLSLADLPTGHVIVILTGRKRHQFPCRKTFLQTVKAAPQPISIKYRPRFQIGDSELGYAKKFWRICKAFRQFARG